MTGTWILLGALALAGVLAVWHRRVNGRFRPTAEAERPEEKAVEPVLDEVTWQSLGAEPGERATLLQFSSAFCAPCRATRVTLGDVASRVPGVAHVEVDAEKHLDLVRRLNILRTPTTLVLDADGAEATRASGAPTRDQVLGALSQMSDTRSA
ncbi:thioredoxin family protein [uncultured Nocardioides sp.]|uniref:thioredoxin family protein n=1 Tax=uncultured Nocardioides sp. TaxID=198441 RepID=UPI002605057C|nr:thioredoxin family protein [uncultured Nocardioides sp.]